MTTKLEEGGGLGPSGRTTRGGIFLRLPLKSSSRHELHYLDLNSVKQSPVRVTVVIITYIEYVLI